MTEKARVYGDRTCRQCKGICHEGSWRQQVGRRKGYWCSDHCLRRHLNERYKKSCQEVGLRRWWEVEYTDEKFQELRDEFYEPVDVIAP